MNYEIFSIFKSNIGDTMNTEIKINLQDTQWKFDYVDHDRNIARAVVYDTPCAPCLFFWAGF